MLSGGPAGAAPRPGWRSPELDGDLYASPLVVGGLVVVATENNTVYAFDPATGTQAWSSHLAEPVDAGTLPCGNIRPVTGITGTPVADAAGGRLYVAAFQRPAQHVLYTLEVATGRVLGRHPVDPPGASAAVHQQREALARGPDGTVYIAYGGLLGDCGDYHGWVVGVPAGGGSDLTYRVPCERECALWAPGGPGLDAAGDLWVATGNSEGETRGRFDFGNAVLRLGPDLTLRDWFAPADYAALSRADADLGSISPALLEDDLAFIAGKQGRGFLLRRGALGHIGGEAFGGPAYPAFSGTAYAPPLLYLACPGQVLALRVDLGAPSFNVAWRRPVGSPGAPIVAFGLLWVIDYGAGTLLALDPAAGDRRYSQAGGPAAHFVTPAAGAGHVYAGMGRRLIAVAVAT